MRPLVIAIATGLLPLTWAAGAGAQAPPSVINPGTPGAPEWGTVPPPLPEVEPLPSRPQPPPLTGAVIPEPAPVPPFEIGLLVRHACVTPRTRGLARAEGGYIDVANPKTDTLVVTMTGSVAANSYLGTTGSAAEVFQLVQEFEVRSTDPRVQVMILTLDSALVGLLRGKHKAVACVERAEISITPLGCDGPPMTLSHPPGCVEGSGGQSCNQHLPPLQTPPLPLGRYVLTAHLVLRASGSGLCDAHAIADFSPDTSQPSDWMRVRDPFQGISKRAFGFITIVTVSPPSAGGAPPRLR